VKKAKGEEKAAKENWRNKNSTDAASYETIFSSFPLLIH
jgi:hypothetical protein